MFKSYADLAPGCSKSSCGRRDPMALNESERAVYMGRYGALSCDACMRVLEPWRSLSTGGLSDMKSMGGSRMLCKCRGPCPESKRTTKLLREHVRSLLVEGLVVLLVG